MAQLQPERWLSTVGQVAQNSPQYSEAFHQAIENLKGEDYNLIQLVLQEKTDSEIAAILGLKSKQAVQYKRTKIEAKLKETMKTWID